MYLYNDKIFPTIGQACAAAKVNNNQVNIDALLSSGQVTKVPVDENIPEFDKRYYNIDGSFYYDSGVAKCDVVVSKYYCGWDPTGELNNGKITNAIFPEKTWVPTFLRNFVSKDWVANDDGEFISQDLKEFRAGMLRLAYADGAGGISQVIKTEDAKNVFPMRMWIGYGEAALRIKNGVEYPTDITLFETELEGRGEEVTQDTVNELVSSNANKYLSYLSSAKYAEGLKKRIVRAVKNADEDHVSIYSSFRSQSIENRKLLNNFLQGELNGNRI